MTRDEVDARRYRWLLSHLPPGTFGDFDVSDADSWAAAIDAAMAEDTRYELTDAGREALGGGK